MSDGMIILAGLSVGLGIMLGIAVLLSIYEATSACRRRKIHEGE